MAFLSLPANRTYEHLRILDLTSCLKLTDLAVQRIIEVAPRLRNLVLAKCKNITDIAVNAISKLGKNLHYVHLGHCGMITDEAVMKLVKACNRIRYIDLGCCSHLTDASVMMLASLPKLRRIGLVKCNLITDDSVLALARARRPMTPVNSREMSVDNVMRGGSEGVTRLGHSLEDALLGTNCLERVHLSYCIHLTLRVCISKYGTCNIANMSRASSLY